MTTRTVMVPASMMVTTLVVALGVPSTVLARGRWQDVIAPRGGHASAPSLTADSKPAPSPERMRAPAPSPERARAPEPDNDPPARTRGSRIVDHDAADRLRQALVEAQDDPHSAGKIQRLIAQAAAEARRNKALGERVWYWRDPFSEHPRQPIVLSLEVQLEMQLWQAREAAARAHMESNSARAEAAAAHAEAARARVVAARAQESRSSSRGVIDEQALLAPPRRPPATAGRDSAASDDVTARRRSARRAAVAKTALAHNESASSPSNRHHDIPARGAASPAADSEEPRTDPATWRSSDPRGIVVVPINTAPPTSPTRRR